MLLALKWLPRPGQPAPRRPRRDGYFRSRERMKRASGRIRPYPMPIELRVLAKAKDQPPVQLTVNGSGVV